MKRTILILFTALWVVSNNAQTTPEERFSTLKENYKIVLDKLEGGTLTLDDENYMMCRKMFKNINSYDKYTTMKLEEFVEIKEGFDLIKPQLEFGMSFLSESSTSKKAMEFSTGKSMFLHLKTGKTTIEESLRPHPDHLDHKVLTLYFEHEIAGTSIIHIDIPKDKWSEKEYILEIPLQLGNSLYSELYSQLGSLEKGKHDFTLILPRGEYAYSINKAVPRIEIPFVLTVQDDSFKTFKNEKSQGDFENTVLEKSVLSDPDLEFMLISIFLNDHENFNVKQISILEDWYELKDQGRLTYMKMNTVFGVKGDDGKCYKVYIDFVQENTSDVGVKLGPIKILYTGAKEKYIPMPCENL
ncbi:MAG: hypothetical protein H6600_04785 [Flavobacteriales bacterium]|nr:hypothetical protein [Flavobacteriales bacterium]MCB9197752.1 hypothetical protein [Flavobacteriales bacterium]